MRADQLGDAEVWAAHAEAKQQLIERVRSIAGLVMDPEVPLIGFARRMTGYKRANLLFSDPDRLRAIARARPFQVVLSGKAHPHDEDGKRIIAQIHECIRELEGEIKIAFLPNYDMDLARALVCGSDIWLNTPLPPLEASGTSGMKAALNGGLNFSVLDGWWVEACVEGVTGWAIGEAWSGGDPDDGADAAAFYEKLESAVIPTFYSRPDAYAHMRRWAIALNGSFFNAERMLLQYAVHAYRLPELAFRRPGADVVEVSEAEALAAGQGEGAEGAPVEASPVAPAEDRSAA